jgi:molecular chaperone IbpA
MNAYDLSPLFRSTVGFDHLSQLIDSAFKLDERGPSYPPYNIAKLSEDDYEITMAVAGFKQSELTITAQQNTLTVSGSTAEKTEDAGKAYLHRGIATRSFERKFSLADHVKVVDAHLADGLLTLRLVREIPEASKPRTIAINATSNTGGKLIEDKASKKAA